MANKYIANDTDLQAVANAIREKGGTSSPLTFPDGFVEAIGDIETGGDASSALSKAVNFIDYDGTVLYNYSESEALALTELPANPSHSGLTSQGWNWTLAQIKARLTAMPGAPVWVGQKYITDDGKTRIYCHFETGRLKPYLGVGVNGTVEVDWGDNSSTDTLTGTSLTTVTTAQHSYSNAGNYIITLTVANGEFAFFGVSNAAHILKKSTDTAENISRVYANAVQYVEMGANVNIGDYAFNSCYSLTSITIPDGVTSIGRYAFNNCYDLTSITISDSVTSIGDYAFYNCYGLTSIIIPDSVTSIGSSAFSYCFSLAFITIPDSVTSISDYTFHNCYGFTFITIPDSVTSIGNYAFDSCYSLTSITIPDSVISIGSYAFNNCRSLTSITIPDSVTSIGDQAFGYCYNLTSITIPDSVTSIGNYVFYNCYGLTSIIIADSVTRISSYMFYNCYGLTSIIIPDSVTSVSSSAFRGCTSLVSITVPDGVTSIGSYAFASCYGLGEIHFLPAATPTVSSSNAFTNVQADCKIYVPAGSLAAYTSATNYPSSSTYTYIEE